MKREIICTYCNPDKYDVERLLRDTDVQYKWKCNVCRDQQEAETDWVVRTCCGMFPHPEGKPMPASLRRASPN